MGSLQMNLAAICTLLSFVYLTETLERHSLAGHPRLSSLLLLSLSGALCMFASLFGEVLPGSHGRFDSYQLLSKTLPSASDDEADPSVRGTTPAHLPPRPRRYSIPLLVCCIVIRLEFFHRVNFQQQCAVTGIESFLPVLLWVYETIINPRLWRQKVKDDDEDNDPWRSVFDDIRDWITSAQPMLVMTLLSLMAISTSTFLSMRQSAPSNYVCFAPLASSSKTLALQIGGLSLDATIIILFWRQLAWSRTTKSRLRSLGSVLALSSVLMGMLWLGTRAKRGAEPLDFALGSLYIFDIIFDSIVFTMLAISAAFWVCSATTVIPATITTILVGLQATVTNLQVIGNWDHLSRTPVLLPLWLMTYSTFWFAYNHPVKTFVLLRRGLFMFLLLILLVAGTIYGLSRPKDLYLRHPVGDLIYRSQREHTSWLNKAKTSMSLPIAVNIYKETHGRDPPPYFHEWYGIARNTAVVDFFQQIDNDLKPFRNISPRLLRERAQLAASIPGVAAISVEKGGKVRRSDAGAVKNKELDELVEIITKYSKWLPEMTIPINLDHQPRILPSWQESQSIQHAHLSSVVGLLSDGEGNVTAAGTPISAKILQAMHLEACSPTSKSRRYPHWRVGEFCSKCTRRHSKSAILTRWERSLEVCQQPDIHQLHSFFLTDPTLAPIGDLLPLFGPSKMDGFQDIILPLPSSIEAGKDVSSEFWERYDTLLWRGTVGEHAVSSDTLGGSQKFRLASLVTSPASNDKVTLISTEGVGKQQRYFWEQTSAADASDVLPISLGFKISEHCTDAACATVKQTYPQDQSSSSIFSYRYVLTTDEDNGPPRDMMSVLRSGSVPFIATTFRTWYTERLTPWMHFVPIDLRYQGLYATYAYFTGTIGRKPINGRESRMKAQRDDAEFIAHSGKRWAEKALGQMDLEMYILRLLLEWGRLIDDKRDKIGFIKDDQGELKNTGWSLRDADGT